MPSITCAHHLQCTTDLGSGHSVLVGLAASPIPQTWRGHGVLAHYSEGARVDVPVACRPGYATHRDCGPGRAPPEYHRSAIAFPHFLLKNGLNQTFKLSQLGRRRRYTAMQDVGMVTAGTSYIDVA